MKITIMITMGEGSLRIYSEYEFGYFPEMAISNLAIFEKKKLKTYIQAKFVKIREVSLVNIIVIFIQKWLENKNFKISQKSTFSLLESDFISVTNLCCYHFS